MDTFISLKSSAGWCLPFRESANVSSLQLSDYPLFSLFMLSLAKPFQYYQARFISPFMHPFFKQHLDIFEVSSLGSCENGDVDLVFSQGVGMGIGLGLTFIPTLANTTRFFNKRRGLASGVALSGSALGATVFPISESTCPPERQF